MFEQPQNIETVQRKPENKTGMPDSLKSGIETLSGMSMDSVRVHYNSSEPARLGALAYTMGNDIHISSGMERHLPHEAWHVVQQMRGIVRPTVKIDGTAVNDEPRLEKEADVMGSRAAQMKTAQCFGLVESMGGKVAQCYTLPVNVDFSSANRRDFQPANGDGLGDTQPVTDAEDHRVSETQRDHIIPMDTIQNFADEIFSPAQKEVAKKSKNFKVLDNLANSWLKTATADFLRRGDRFFDEFTRTPIGERPTSSFYLDENGNIFRSNLNDNMSTYIDGMAPADPGELDYYNILLKAISWMPGNIFMAPHPKKDDRGNKFDVTALTAVEPRFYNDLKNTYLCMIRFLGASNKGAPEALANKQVALKGLRKIAGRSSVWKYNPEQWTFNETTGQFEAKNVDRSFTE